MSPYRSILVAACVLATGGPLSAQHNADGEAFLATYRPRAAALYEHLFRNVTMTAESSDVSEDYSRRISQDKIEFISNRDRYRRTFFRPSGRQSVLIFRPDAMYNPYSDPDKPFVLADAAVLPPELAHLSTEVEWWRTTENDNHHGFGIGFMIIDGGIYDFLTDGTLRIDKVSPINATDLCVEATQLPNPAKRRSWKFFFRKPHYIAYLIQDSWLNPDSKFMTVNHVYQYAMLADDLSSYIPVSYERSFLLKPGDETSRTVTHAAVVTSFKKETHPESAFRLEQYGLPELDTGPRRSSWLSRGLVAGAVLIMLGLLTRAWLRRRQARRAGAAA